MNPGTTPWPAGRSGNPDPDDAGAIRAAIGRWVGQQESVAPAVLEAWTEQLSDRGVVWTVCGPHLPQLLDERFRVVSELLQRWEASPAPNAPRGFQEWLAHGRQIREHWPPVDAGGWQTLLGELSRQGNALVDAIIAQAMVAAWQAHRVPRSVTQSLAPLVQTAVAWSRTVPLPPAGRLSLNPDDYVLLHQRAEQCAALEESAEQIAKDVETARLNIERSIPKGGDRQLVETLTSCANAVRVALREWTDLLGQGRRGLPIEAAALLEHAEAFFATVAPLQQLSHPFAASIRNRLEQTLPQVRAIATQVLSEPTAGSPLSAEPAAPAPREPKMQRSTQLDTLSCVVTLSGDDAAGDFAERLNDLAAAWKACEQTGDDALRAAALRKLVGCLISLDQQADQPKPPAWVVSAREELRELLADEGSYRLLDEELVGDGIERHQNWADAVGHTTSKTVKSGFIAAVQRPGYAVRQGDGSWRVLQKARVLLAR